MQARTEYPPAPAADRSPLRRRCLFAEPFPEENPIEDDRFAGLGAEALSEAERGSVASGEAGSRSREF